jgi:hypothetical protein
MNVINEIFRRFLIRDGNVSLQLLQTNNCNMIAIIISYIPHIKNDTEQMRYNQSRIHRSQQQNEHLPYPRLLIYINCYYEYNTDT